MSQAIAIPGRLEQVSAPTVGLRPASALALALVLSACLVYAPWDQISRAGFPDRDNYLLAIQTLRDSGAQLFDFGGADLLALLLNEYLWRQVEIAIGNYFADPLAGFLLVSLTAGVLLTYLVLRRAGTGYALLFLLSPLTIDLLLEQTRSALALGVFLMGLSIKRRSLSTVLFLVAFMLHSAGAILIVTHLIASFALRSRTVHTRYKLGTMLTFGLAVSVMLAYLSQAIFAAIGDRRAVQDVMRSSSILVAIWWVVLMATLVGFARLKTRADSGEYVMLAVVLLAVFVFGTLFGAGVSRFLSLSLPLASIAICSIRMPLVRLALIGGTASFNLVLFLFYWMA